MRLIEALLLAGSLLTVSLTSNPAGAVAPQAGTVAPPSPASAKRKVSEKAPEPGPSPKRKDAKDSNLRDCISGRIVALDPTIGAPLHLGTQSYPQTLRFCDHVVALTFDDGPSPETTPQVLRALKEADVRASFFLIGRLTRLHPDLARQEYEEGHTVGHHSYTHPSFTLRGFDEPSGEQDIQNGIAEDEKAIYGAQATPAFPHVPFFRFPGFADTPQLLSDLDRRRIAVFGSDLWAADWLLMTPDYEVRKLMTALENRPHHNGIILLHDSRPSTAAMLPAFLHRLRDEGYRVVQIVYAKDAARPPLTAPLNGEPETKRIIAHLRTPIVPGVHHLPSEDETAAPLEQPPGEGQP